VRPRDDVDTREAWSSDRLGEQWTGTPRRIAKARASRCQANIEIR
jgi:hypothetical protein